MSKRTATHAPESLSTLRGELRIVSKGTLSAIRFMPERLCKVLIVDDHPLFRAGLATLLRNQIGYELVGEARDGLEALEIARKLRPDMVLIDIYMPEMDGLQAARLIKAELPAVKIVVLTVSEERDDVLEAVKAGAQGYILKGMEAEQLLQTLRGISQGEVHFHGRGAGSSLSEFARVAAGSRNDATLQNYGLSARQYEVLMLLSDGVSNKQIALSLGISENTAKNHIKSIFAKLDVKNRSQAVAFAIKKTFKS